jgi:hypothetical protein
MRKGGSGKHAFSLLYLLIVRIRIATFNVGDFLVIGTKRTSSHNQGSKKADICGVVNTPKDLNTCSKWFISQPFSRYSLLFCYGLH